MYQANASLTDEPRARRNIQHRGQRCAIQTQSIQTSDAGLYLLSSKAVRFHSAANTHHAKAFSVACSTDSQQLRTSGMIEVIVADGDIDIVQESGPELEQHKADLRDDLGCTLRVFKFNTWEEAESFEDEWSWRH